jgi:hypothetical protein
MERKPEFESVKALLGRDFVWFARVCYVHWFLVLRGLLGKQGPAL